MRNFLQKVKKAWNWKKPLLMIRLLVNLIKVYCQHKQLLRYVDLSIGERCNMSCPHCFVGSQKEINIKKRKDTEKRISPKYYRKVVDQAMKLGACSFSFQGGEPLIYDDLKDYIKAARPHLNLISITTNGQILDYAKAKELKSWGVDIVTISMDEYRPKDTWDKACEAIFAARRAGLKVTIGTVVSHTSLYGDFFLKLNTIAGSTGSTIMVMMAVPMGALAGKTEEMLDEFDVDWLRRMEKNNDHIQTDFQVNWKEYNCGAGREILYIKHTGETFACPFIPISFGNVGRHSVEHIRNEILKCDVINDNRDICIAGEKGGLHARITEGKNEKRT